MGLSFCGKNGMAIFTSHNDSIKQWIDSFVVVKAKGSFDWGLELGWGTMNTFCNAFPSLFEWKQLYFSRISSFPFKCDVFKCLDIHLGRDVMLLVFNYTFVAASPLIFLLCAVIYFGCFCSFRFSHEGYFDPSEFFSQPQCYPAGY